MQTSHYQAARLVQYQRLKPFKAISFDLDDTLYNNRPIIENAVAASFALLNQAYPKTLSWSAHDWQTCKLELCQQMPELNHDTSAARYATLRQGLVQLGYCEIEASKGAQLAMECFQFHRSDFSIDAEVLAVLEKLGAHYPLIGITNGNVDASRIGLDKLMKFVLHPGHGIKMKPAQDMFKLACRQLDIDASQLLHIGDHPVSDIVGAKMAGCQTVWLNPCQQDRFKEVSSLLPCVEISKLNQLESFCCGNVD
ncbi:HAD-IA family hydrolase [Shewanella aestuarii]|uniref:HAD-IA family hydrolase n=2 Tax=Shewanella aestuarii TaxID=1028752 RepID=A0A6G9QQC2_9GAMM|nr:HAD-IA family hydrolase [Shewanella aestuarii]QIR16265.1 HAD-IA family hydrolase [Shewanella aestuarii]